MRGEKFRDSPFPSHDGKTYYRVNKTRVQFAEIKQSPHITLNVISFFPTFYSSMGVNEICEAIFILQTLNGNLALYPDFAIECNRDALIYRICVIENVAKGNY